jgi:hypothetical protein
VSFTRCLWEFGFLDPELRTVLKIWKSRTRGSPSQISYDLVFRNKRLPAKQLAPCWGEVSFTDGTPGQALKGVVIRRCMEIKGHKTRRCMEIKGQEGAWCTPA